MIFGSAVSWQLKGIYLAWLAQLLLSEYRHVLPKLTILLVHIASLTVALMADDFFHARIVTASHLFFLSLCFDLKLPSWGVHAYKFINNENQVKYVKFHWKSQQGVEGLRPNEVTKMQGQNFNHLTDDLYTQINKGNFPKWDLKIKVLSPKDLSKFDYNPLDATKMWLDVPETTVGTMTLNRVPGNFFQETEQVAFAPSNLIPGIEPSEDKLLQGRIFSYADTQLYRLGANLSQLPINQTRVKITNHNQDGALDQGETTSDINYQPSAHLPLAEDNRYRPPVSGLLSPLKIIH